MKSLKGYLLYTLALVLLLHPAIAQDWVFDPGTDFTSPSNQALNALPGAPDDLPAGGLQLLATSSSSSGSTVSLTSDLADAIFPEISNLANALGNDPAKISEFVLNSIPYEHYYGSKKGARLTLLEGAGNDYDQASLLVALFRAAGYPAGYATEWNIVYYDYPNNSSVPSAINWLGLSDQPLSQVTLGAAAEAERIAWGWTVEQYKQVLVLKNFCESRGFEVLSFTDLPGAVLLKRTVASIEMTPGNVFLVDASAKPTTENDKMDLLSGSGFNESAFLSAIGGTLGSNYISEIDEADLQTEYGNLTSALVTAIQTDRSGDTVDELLGKRGVVRATIGSISSNVSFPKVVIQSSPYVTEYFAQVPASAMSTLEIQVNTSSVHSIPMPELAGQRLSVTHAGSQVKIWLEDNLRFERTVSGSAGVAYDLKMEAKHPHFKSATQEDVDAGLATTVGQTIPRNDGDTSNVYKRSDDMAYALIYGFSPTQRFFRHRNDVLDGILNDIREFDASLFNSDGTLDLDNLSDAALRRKVVTELLNVMGLNWLYQTERVNQMTASVTDTNVVMLHRFGRMAQEEGFFVDVGLQRASNQSPDGGNSNAQVYGSTFSYMFSALEHGIIDQYEFEANAAVSTIQILHLANSSTDPEKNRIYFADSNNWSSVSGQLRGYSGSEKSAFQALLNDGTKLILPRNKNNGATDWDWDGSGYIKISPTPSGGLSIGMIITGDFETAGGWNTNYSYVDPAPIFQTNISTPNYSNYSGASTISLSSTPSWSKPSFFSWDPVDMASGAFVFDRTDMSLGGSGTRGLQFSRHYNSNRNLINSSNLGYGWTHNYDIRASVRTAPEAGLGEATAEEAAPMLAAVAVIAALVDTPENLKEMVSGALLAKYAVDNLLNNAVSVTLGKETVQFIEHPDGSYVAPAGSTMSLIGSGSEWIMSERFGSQWTFDQSNDGRVTEIENQFGAIQDFDYNTDGTLNKVIDADARTLTFGYTNNLISSVTDSTGRSIAFQYSGDEDLTHATDPENKTARFYYDTVHRIDELRDPDGRIIVQNQYDSEGRVEEQVSEGDTDKTWSLTFSGYENIETDPLGGQKVYTYDQQGRATAIANELGETTTIEYDGHNQILRQVSPGGLETRSSYDRHHNLRVRSTAPVGVINGFLLDSSGGHAGTYTANGVSPEGLLETFNYDSSHRILEHRHADLSGSESPRVTVYSYSTGNETNLPNTVTDPEGNQTLYTYYADGQVHTQTQVSTSGNLTTTYTYDSRGMPQSVSYPDTSQESFVYNERGDMTTQTNPRSKTTSYLYNARRQLVQETAADTGVSSRTYDNSSNLLTVTDAETSVTRYTYSPQKKLLTETMAYGTPEAATVTHEYDERDWRVRTIDPLNRVTEFDHDAAGRVTMIIDPLDRETTFTHDADGNRTSETTPEGITTEFAYNERGEQTTMTDPADSVVTYDHNIFGEQVALNNRRGNEYGFTFDANGNPLTTSTPLDNTTTIVYNDLNQVESVEEPSTQTTTFIYDDLGRVESQTDPVGTITYGRDANGNPETVTEGSDVLNRTFDDMDRVATYTDADGNELEYTYFKNGLLKTIKYPDDKTVTYAYDAQNRLKTVTDWSSRVTSYEWDDAGRLTGITRPNGTSRVNQYTDANELDRFYEYGSGQNSLHAYTRFAYDEDSRIESRYRLPEPQAYALPKFDATYDIDNRVSTWNAAPVSHDVDGNMTTGPLPGVADFVSYNFDARNRLTSVSGTNYFYDAENNRIAQADASGTTSYVIDPHGDALPRVLIREKPDGTITRYVYGIGLLYEVDESDEATHYHFDQSGSTIALTDSSGAVSDRVEYSPFGTITHRTGTTDTPYLYAGQFGIQQEANGLLHMRARYYSPELQRFISSDPARFDGGMNWYAYANNSPLLFIDPTGLFFGTPLTFSEFVGAAVSGAMSGAKTYVKGLATGVAVGAVVAGGAAAAVAIGVPTAVVTGTLFVGATAGAIYTGYDIYKNPSLENITFNTGALAGGFLVGGAVARPLGARLSPTSHRQSVSSPTIQQEFSMMWRGSDGNRSLSTLLFQDFGTAMGTGPTFGAMIGSVGFTSGGISSSFK